MKKLKSKATVVAAAPVGTSIAYHLGQRR